jgi:class 3 adenylate cyclase
MSAVEAPDTRYAWNGDAALAYQVVGDGDIDLFYIPASGVSNVEVMWESLLYRRFLQRLASFSRLIVMDRRGFGCSERYSPTEVAPLEVMVDDILAVLDEVGSDRCALFTFDATNFVACMTAASQPDRVSHAILLEPEPAWIRDDEITWTWSHQDWDAYIDLVRRGWGQHLYGDKMMPEIFPSIVDDERERRWMTRFERLSQSPGAAVAELRKYWQTDVRAILPTIHVPTLVLHRARDAWADVRSARYVADHIPGSRFVELPGRDHAPWGEEMDALVSEIEEFLTGERRARETDRILATVLFTDIVGSTRKAAEVGDARWKELLAEHDELAKAEIARARGRYIRSTGDGLLATFDGPARAVRCAHSIGSSVRSLGIEIRAGCHTGEIELADDHVRGLAVHIWARVSELAGPGEVLVSSTIKDLTAGSGLVLEDVGEHELKGVPDRWRLYRVVS